MDERKIFGNRGEDLAAEALTAKGLRVIQRQYKNQFGEIDLICQDGDEIVFVEVKSRESDSYGYPEDAVTPNKIRHILMVSEGYLASLPQERPWRIDVVAIEFAYEPPRITHIEGIDIPERYW
jgi:putative endonuclease